jgi:hypothetical protein
MAIFEEILLFKGLEETVIGSHLLFLGDKLFDRLLNIVFNYGCIAESSHSFGDL